MAREQKGTQKRSEASLLDRRSYLRLAGSTVAAVASGSAGAVAQSDSDSSSPTIDRFDIAKSSQLGSNQMFSVQWAASTGDENLDVVEMVVNGSNTDLDFAVQDVSGTSASGWELFQFPLGITLDVHVRVKDLGGNVSKKSKTVSLGETSEADIHIPFQDTSDLESFTEMKHDNNSIVSAPDRDGNAFEVPIPEGSHYGTSCTCEFAQETGSEPTEAYAEYYVYHSESFEYVDAGPGGSKLPGFSGTYGQAGWGGRPADGTNGWSARMLNTDPDRTGTPRDLGLAFYTYHADQSGTYGDELHWDVGVNKGEWHKIGQYVKMNTPGSNDGILRGWVDDDLAFDRENLRFRDSGYDNIKIEEFWFNVYHGGGWTSPTDTEIYFDDLKIKKNADSL